MAVKKGAYKERWFVFQIVKDLCDEDCIRLVGEMMVSNLVLFPGVLEVLEAGELDKDFYRELERSLEV